MPGRPTLTRQDIAESIRREIGLSHRDAREMVDGILFRMCEALSREGAVKISGFGTFHVRSKGARPGRNPVTGEAHPIPARRTLHFRPSQLVKERVR